MESWRTVWREGFAPSLSTNALLKLREALENTPELVTQGKTTQPPSLNFMEDKRVESACAIGLCGWLGEGILTVGEVNVYFARCCHEADQRLGEPAACRWFLNWFDDAPREEMQREMIAEIDWVLNQRMETNACGVSDFTGAV